MTRRHLTFEIFLICLAAILVEVSYTRIVSFKLVYYFTYVIIAIALLGFGAGGVLVAMFPRLRASATTRMVPAYCLMGATAVLASYAVVAWLPVNALDLVRNLPDLQVTDRVWEVVKLCLLCFALFLPFLAAGLAISAIFAANAEGINRLYFFDLLGAGIGCAISVPLMAMISPPGCVVLAGVIFAVAGLPLAVREARSLVVPLVVVAAVLLPGVVFPDRLPDPIVDRAKTMGRAARGPVVFSRWDPVFRVDVIGQPRPDGVAVLRISHDAMWGSVLPRFDGNFASLTRYDRNIRAYPFRLATRPPRVLIIGAAGGNEILASLYFDAAHVTAVELNPVTVSLLTDHFRDFTGRIAEHERVTLVNAEGRSFLMSSEEKFDVIWFVTPDSYAAMNAAASGAYVLSESYLYTVEMLHEALEHLSPDGMIVTLFGGEWAFEEEPTRTARHLATAREAFRKIGVEDFSRHVMVATSPGAPFLASTIILKRSPVTSDDIRRFGEATANLKGGRVRYTWQHSDPEHPVSKIVVLPPDALEAFYDAFPYEVRPVWDDAPFFWHFARFRTALDPIEKVERGHESGVGERLLVLLILICTVLSSIFLLAPLLARRAVWAAIPHKAVAAVYFAALGSGFMLLEVSLIQRLTLFLGFPTYSLTVTLFALLVSTGIGSHLSSGLVAPPGRVLVGLAACLVGLLTFYLIALTPIVHAFVGASLVFRVTLSVAVLTPLGLCLGVFMPLGLRTVATLTPHREEYVAWAWAINGFFSVLSSLVATILSMTVGFTNVMLISLGIYLIGILALAHLLRSQRRLAHPAPG